MDDRGTSDKQIRFSIGALFMVISGFSLSTVILFSRICLTAFGPPLLVFLRFIIPTTLLFFFLWIKEKNQVFLHFLVYRENKLKIVRAFLIVSAQMSILFYLTKGNLLDATVLLNTGPLFIPIFEKVFLKHRIGKSTIAAMLVSAVGVILILKPGATIIQPISLLGLLAGVCQGGSQVLFGMYAKEEKGAGPLLRLFFLSSLFTLIFLLAAAPHDFTKFVSGISQERILIFLFLLGIFSILNQYFRSRAYFHGKPSTMACFFYSSILFSAAFDWIFFQKIPDTLTFIGAGFVILGGILKIYLRHKILKKRDTEKKK